MPPEDLDRFVSVRMRAVMAGDDEALNALVLELREMALAMIPREAYLLAPVDICTQAAFLALHEALLLWSPRRCSFGEALEWRVRMRLGALFLRVKDLKEEVARVARAE